MCDGFSSCRGNTKGYLKLYRITFILSFFFFFSTLNAQGNYDFNARCQNAWKEIFSMRTEQGKKLLAEEKSEHPENLIPLLLESYADLLKVIAADNRELLPQFKSAKNARLDALKKGSADSPWKKYAEAEAQLHYALAAFQCREYWQGLTDMRKAYFLLEENMRLHPDFLPNKKSYFTIQALLGAVPEKYQWGLKLMGLQGNLQQGLTGLKALLAEPWGEESFLKEEARHILILLLFHLEGEKKRAWEELQQAGYPLKENLFSFYAAIQIALYSNHNDAATAMLRSLPRGDAYSAFPVLDYYAGIAHLNKLEAEEARSDFQKFLSETTGMNFIKSANQKIAWSYLAEGDSTGYRKYRNTAAASGAALTEADKQAQKEADDEAMPHPEILRARLLFDGGYFQDALKMLESVSKENLRKKDRLELVYRSARALHETGDTVRAIERYMVTLGEGRNEPYYYAANAALNLAWIYEAKGNKQLAKHYFNECLALDNHEYKASLAQKAKAGLERVK